MSLFDLTRKLHLVDRRWKTINFCVEMAPVSLIAYSYDINSLGNVPQGFFRKEKAEFFQK